MDDLDRRLAKKVAECKKEEQKNMTLQSESEIIKRDLVVLTSTNYEFKVKNEELATINT